MFTFLSTFFLVQLRFYFSIAGDLLERRWSLLLKVLNRGPKTGTAGGALSYVHFVNNAKSGALIVAHLYWAGFPVRTLVQVKRRPAPIFFYDFFLYCSSVN